MSDVENLRRNIFDDYGDGSAWHFIDWSAVLQEIGAKSRVNWSLLVGASVKGMTRLGHAPILFVYLPSPIIIANAEERNLAVTIQKAIQRIYGNHRWYEVEFVLNQVTS